MRAARMCNASPRKLHEIIGELKILLEAASLKTWITATPVIGCQIIDLPETATQEPSSQRTVGHDTEPEPSRDG